MPSKLPNHQNSVFINTNGICLLCYDDCPPPEVDKQEANKKKKTSLNFCTLISRYLGFGLEESVVAHLKAMNTMKKCGKVEKIEIDLCNRCTHLADAFCHVYSQLQFNQMILDRCVKTISELLKDAEKKANAATFTLDQDEQSLKAKKKFTRLTMGNFRSAKNLRDKIKRKCLSKLRSSYPIVRLKRITKIQVPTSTATEDEENNSDAQKKKVEAEYKENKYYSQLQIGNQIQQCLQSSSRSQIEAEQQTQDSLAVVPMYQQYPYQQQVPNEASKDYYRNQTQAQSNSSAKIQVSPWGRYNHGSQLYFTPDLVHGGQTSSLTQVAQNNDLESRHYPANQNYAYPSSTRGSSPQVAQNSYSNAYPVYPSQAYDQPPSSLSSSTWPSTSYSHQIYQNTEMPPQSCSYNSMTINNNYSPSTSYVYNNYNFSTQSQSPQLPSSIENNNSNNKYYANGYRYTTPAAPAQTFASHQSPDCTLQDQYRQNANSIIDSSYEVNMSQSTYHYEKMDTDTVPSVRAQEPEPNLSHTMEEPPKQSQVMGEEEQIAWERLSSTEDCKSMGNPTFPEVHWSQKILPTKSCPNHGCMEAFVTDGQLKLHLRAHGSFKCNFCHLMFGKAHNLALHEKMRHARSHVGTGKYKCSRCDFLSVSQHNFFLHFLCEHLKISVYDRHCLVCKKGFVMGTTPMHIQTHYKTYHDIQGKDSTSVFTCGDCNAPFLKYHQLVVHRQLIHKST